MAYFNQHQSMISKRYLTFFSKSKKKKPFSAGQLIGLILGPLLFLLTLLFFHPQDLPWEGVYVLAITLWIATWWITEAIPIAKNKLITNCVITIRSHTYTRTSIIRIWQ